MTDRIPLDHLTSDALDALYEQLEAAEDTESQRQLAVAREALASATTRAARAETALALAEQRLARVQRLLDSGPIGTCCDHLLRAALDARPVATQATERDCLFRRDGGRPCNTSDRCATCDPKEQP